MGPPGTGTGDELGEYQGLVGEQERQHQTESDPALPTFDSQTVGSKPRARPILSWRPPSKLTLPILMVGIILCEFLRGLDAGALPAILAQVAVDLKGSSTDTYWSGSAYLFAATATQPVLGGFAVAVGRRLCIFVCILVFITGSILTATAQSIIWLILARVVQGVGAGGMDIMFSLVIVEMVPLGKLAIYSSMTQLAAGAGVVWGQLIGAVILEKTSWRYIFWINVPIAGVPLFILPMLVKERNKDHGNSLRAQLKSMDWIGIVIVTGSLITLLYALFSGGVVAPWSSGRILAPLAIGLAGIILFVVHEDRWAHKCCTAGPLIPMRLFGNRTSRIGYTIVLLHGIVISVVIFNYTLYLFSVDDIDFVGLAVRSLPSAIVPLGSAGIASYLITKIGSFKWFNIVGLSVLSIGLGVVSTLKATSPLRDQIGFQFIYSIGMGILFPGRSMAAVVSQSRQEDQPQAQATVAMGFNLGQTFGLAIGSAVLQNTWDRLVQTAVVNGKIPPGHIIMGSQVEQSVQVIQFLPEALKIEYREVATGALQSVWLVTLGLTGATLILSLFMKNIRFGIGLPKPLWVDKEDLDTDSERLIPMDELNDVGVRRPKSAAKMIELYIPRY